MRGSVAVLCLSRAVVLSQLIGGRKRGNRADCVGPMLVNRWRWGAGKAGGLEQ